MQIDLEQRETMIRECVACKKGTEYNILGFRLAEGTAFCVDCRIAYNYISSVKSRLGKPHLSIDQFIKDKSEAQKYREEDKVPPQNQKSNLTESVIDTDGKSIWRHIDAEGNEYWCNDKKQYHRVGGPAFINAIKTKKMWYLNGHLHRKGGPAVEWLGYNKSHYDQYWEHGEKIDRPKKVPEKPNPGRYRNEQLEPYVEGEPYFEIDSWGHKYWYNAKDQYHRTEGPAIEYAKGGKVWYSNGKLHQAVNNPNKQYSEKQQDEMIKGCFAFIGVGLMMALIGIPFMTMYNDNYNTPNYRDRAAIETRYEASKEKEKREQRDIVAEQPKTEQSLADDLRKYIETKNTEIIRLMAMRSKTEETIVQFSSESIIGHAQAIIAEIDSKIQMITALRDKAESLMNDVDAFTKLEEIRKWMQEN